MKWLLNDAPIPVTEACQASGLAFNTIDHDWTDGPAQIDYLCKIGGGDYRFGRVRRTFDVVDPEHDILPSDHYGIWTKFVK